MLPFQLPPPAGYSDFPLWNGKNFVIGDQYLPVLEYSENFQGWSDDLTALHEAAAGDSHPIDLASRYDALLQVKKTMPTAQAVILEIGCSSGFLIRDMVKHLPEAIILGGDVVKEPLFRLAKSLPGIPLLRFDLLKCPLPDRCIDVLVMLNVLEHIEDDDKALQKVFNLLKPGGSLVVEVPAGPLLYDTYDVELQHFRRYSASGLHAKLIKTGFIVCRISHLGFFLYPAFILAKLFNKLFFSYRNKTVVQEQAAQTSVSVFVRFAMEFESKYLSAYQLPFGIRVLALGVKKS